MNRYLPSFIRLRLFPLSSYLQQQAGLRTYEICLRMDADRKYFERLLRYLRTHFAIWSCTLLGEHP